MIDFQRIAYTLLGVLFTWTIYEIREHKKQIADHEKRIQHIEDLHGRDIEEIKKMLQELAQDVKALNKYVHRENNDMIDLINQQKNIIEIMHRHMNEVIK